MDTSSQDGRLDTKVWAKPIMNKKKEIVSIVSSLYPPEAEGLGGFER